MQKLNAAEQTLRLVPRVEPLTSQLPEHYRKVMTRYLTKPLQIDGIDKFGRQIKVDTEPRTNPNPNPIPNWKANQSGYRTQDGPCRRGLGDGAVGKEGVLRACVQ